MTLINLKNIHPDPRNANICDEEILSKLQAHIERTEFCPPLIVREHPEKKHHFMMIDGHHRILVLERLGWTEAPCVICDVPEEEVEVLLLTLNQLRGIDIPRKRAELIASLNQRMAVSDIARLLPETTGEIEGLLALLKKDTEAMAQALKEQIEREKASLPVPFGFLVLAEDAALVHETLALYKGQKNRDQGAALVAICRDVMALHYEEALENG